MEYNMNKEVYNIVSSMGRTICVFCEYKSKSFFEYPCNVCSDNGNCYSQFEYKKGTFKEFGKSIEKYLSSNYDEDRFVKQESEK